MSNNAWSLWPPSLGSFQDHLDAADVTLSMLATLSISKSLVASSIDECMLPESKILLCFMDLRVLEAMLCQPSSCLALGPIALGEEE